MSNTLESTIEGWRDISQRLLLHVEYDELLGDNKENMDFSDYIYGLRNYICRRLNINS